jgi:very-short-patch-repair endonuclease
MERIRQLLQGTEHLNPGLAFSEGRPFYQAKPLAAYGEGVQLLFRAVGCTGSPHYRLMTPNAVSRGADMNCCFCIKPSKYETERAISQALQQAELDTDTTWQYQPNWLAAGRVDFYMFKVGVVVQVDGSAHTQGIYSKQELPQPLQQDLCFNVRAWQAGAKVMRVLHTDLNDAELHVQLQLAAGVGGDRNGPWLALSPEYMFLTWVDAVTQERASYISRFLQAIGGSCRVQRSHGGWSWVLPLTL